MLTAQATGLNAIRGHSRGTRSGQPFDPFSFGCWARWCLASLAKPLRVKSVASSTCRFTPPVGLVWLGEAGAIPPREVSRNVAWVSGALGAGGRASFARDGGVRFWGGLYLASCRFRGPSRRPSYRGHWAGRTEGLGCPHAQHGPLGDSGSCCCCAVIRRPFTGEQPPGLCVETVAVPSLPSGAYQLGALVVDGHPPRAQKTKNKVYVPL